MSSAARRRLRIPVPGVLRGEPRYRLLFAGQALSVIGDRITYVALAFAVLDIGTVADLGWVTAAAAVWIMSGPRRQPTSPRGPGGGLRV